MTLKHRHKCMAIGLEMVDPNIKCNVGICLGMVRIEDGTDKVGHETLSKIFKERVGYEYNEIVHTTTSDRAAKGISTMFHHDEDVCDMHDCDKIGRSAIGDLIRKRKKVQYFLLFNLSTLLLIFSVSQFFICTFCLLYICSGTNKSFPGSAGSPG